MSSEEFLRHIESCSREEERRVSLERVVGQRQINRHDDNIVAGASQSRRYQVVAKAVTAVKRIARTGNNKQYSHKISLHLYQRAIIYQRFCLFYILPEIGISDGLIFKQIDFPSQSIFQRIFEVEIVEEMIVDGLLVEVHD
jgi:hypothetical protein